MNQLLKKLPLYALFLLFLALPLSKGMASVGFAVLVGATILTKRNWLSSLKEHKNLLGLSLLFIWLAIGLLYSEHFVVGSQLLFKHLSLLAMPVVLVMNRDIIQRYYKPLLTCFVIAVLINCGITWILNFISPELVLSIHEQYPNLLPINPVKSDSLHFGVYSPLISRIQLSNLISIAALISAFLFLRKHLRWFQLPALVLLLLYSVSFGGRGGQLGLLSGLGIFCMLVLAFYKNENTEKNKWIKYIRWALPILVIGLSAFLYKGYEPIQKRYQQLIWELQLYQSGDFKKYDYQHFTSLRRIVSWQNTYKVVKANPILGVGIGDYPSEINKVYKNDDFDLPVNYHNQYLTFATFGGGIALFLFLSSMLFWLNFLKQRELYLFIFGLAFLITYGVIFMFDAALYFQVDRFLFTLLFGVIPFCKKN